MSLIIPSSFLYSAWTRDLTAFLGICGLDCSVAPASDRRILDKGVSLSCEEFCLPLKLFCGHVALIAESADDRILVPVITGNTACDSFLCHLQQRSRDIILGLELIGSERVVSPVFTYDDSLRLEESGFHELGQLLGLARETVLGALAERARNLECRKETVSRELAAAGRVSADDGKAGVLRIAITGNPPVTEDALLGGDILRLLSGLGASAEVPLMGGFSLSAIPKDIRHFTYDAFARAQIETALADARYDGVVYLQAFLCGPGCSTAVDFGRLEKQKPFLPLVLDQTQSSGGMETRLEAFLDMVKAMKAGVR